MMQPAGNDKPDTRLPAHDARDCRNTLTALERDALGELVNISVSRAANSLRQLVDEEVRLTVPSVAILSRPEADAIIREGGAEPMIAVRQAFHGEFSGCALVIFPERSSLELVRAVTKVQLALEDIIELEQEALAEIGNVILNACVATIANLLQRNLVMSLPEVVRGADAGFFDLSPADVNDGLLVIRVNFNMKDEAISGHLAIVMHFPALAALRAILADFIKRMTQ